MDKKKTNRMKRRIAWGCLGALVLLLAVLPLLAAPESRADGPQASILSTQVCRTDITQTLIGGGTLASEGSEALTVPSAVKLKEYLVGNGDVVAKGDPIAVVDRVSVMSAITGIQETLDHLDGKIEAASGETLSGSITAQVNGTVKTLYAAEGDDVQEVMLEHGALAVISLDGKMAVKLEQETQLAAGDAVCIFLADGHEAEGTVASNREGSLVITLEDQGYTVGEPVTVATQEGDQLGSGALYVHSPWNVYGYSGTVFSVSVAEGQSVYAGQMLLRLTDTGIASEYQTLLSQRREYEELMQELFVMYDTQLLTAPCDGIVSGVDTEGAFLLSSGGESAASLLSNSAANHGSSYRVVLLSSDALPLEEDPAEPPEGELPPEEEVPDAPYQGYCAVVVATGEDTVTVLQNPTPVPMQDATGGSAPTSIAGMSQSAIYAHALFATLELRQWDLILVVTDSEGAVQNVIKGGNAAQSPMGGMTGGDMGGMSGGLGGFGGGMQPEVFEPYSLETQTVATVTSQEVITLDVTVDEADILLLRVGQKAQLLVTPLGGAQFEAEITKISNSGTNSGGRTKFTVTATTQKHRDMYPGMSAALILSLDTAQNVAAVPVEALVEEGTKTFVYTGYDSEKEVLINPVEVTTGISDGEMVEISGLEEGAEVWYAYYDTLEQSLSPESRRLF